MHIFTDDGGGGGVFKPVIHTVGYLVIYNIFYCQDPETNKYMIFINVLYHFISTKIYLVLGVIDLTTVYREKKVI